MMASAVEVRERPILMSAEMVWAVLDGRKSQTRRVVQHPRKDGTWEVGIVDDGTGHGDPLWIRRCPYGQIGDHLYVREAHFVTNTGISIYRADYPGNAEARGLENIPTESDVRWSSSIHMPKRYARIWLEVTDIRAERGAGHHDRGRVV